MGIKKALKNKLAEQQGYQQLSVPQTEQPPQPPAQPVSAAKRHELSICKGAFIVFLLGLVFWSSLANICVNALIREYPNATGNPRVSPILNMGVSTLALLTSLMGCLWLWRRHSFIIFIGFFTFALLTALYLISSAAILGWTFGGKLRDCPHDYTVYTYHSYHHGWTFTCEKFNMGMYTLALSSLSFDAISFISLILLLGVSLVHQIRYLIDSIEEKEAALRGYSVVDVEAASA